MMAKAEFLRVRSECDDAVLLFTAGDRRSRRIRSSEASGGGGDDGDGSDTAIGIIDDDEADG
jgi:hypothetical protein